MSARGRTRRWVARRALGGAAGAALALAACGGRREAARRAPDAGVATSVAPAEVTVALLPLGKASLDEFGWRSGPGAAAFARALAAEQRGDLAAVEREASAALAADAGHLEAAWLAAVARARLGRPAEVLAPLEIAAAGDWAKWGERSLELAALAGFRATPTGRGWVRAAEGYRAALAALTARAVIVVGARPGRGAGVGRELYAVDVRGGALGAPDPHGRRGGGRAARLPGAPLDRLRHGQRKGARGRPGRGDGSRSSIWPTGRAGREVALRRRARRSRWRGGRGPMARSRCSRRWSTRRRQGDGAIGGRLAPRQAIAPVAKPAPLRGERLELGADARRR
jgi:hypothetical protein